MESLGVSPTAEPRGSSDVEDEFFFLKLFLGCKLDSASQVRAAPIETELFWVKARPVKIGFYFGLVVSQVL